MKRVPRLRINCAAFGRTLIWVWIGSDEGGKVKILFSEGVRLVAEVLGAGAGAGVAYGDVRIDNLCFLLVAPGRRDPGAKPKGRQRRRRTKAYRRM
jgi:hypothetical protein